MTDLDKAKKIMLKLLIEFDRVCQKHSLTYWMDFGTLLGAVRHQGFIPWDDDIDISMPLEDYDKLRKIIQTELPADMVFQHKETDPKYKLANAKLRDLNSIYHEVDNSSSYNGIFIDVFPVYIIDNKYRKIIKWIHKYNTLSPSKKWYPSKIHRIGHIALSPLLLFKPLVNLFIKRLGSGTENQLYTKNLNSDIYGIYKKAYCDQLIDLTFEGFKFKAPKDYDGVLTDLYGNYMELPPEGEREYRHLLNITFLNNSIPKH